MKTVSTFPAKKALVVALLSVGFSQSVLADSFLPGDLIVSETTYSGTASTVTVGQALPGGGVATADGSFPNVFKNEVPDPSFGVTSAISLLKMNSTSGAVTSITAIDTSKMVTSFASKSELALNMSTDGQSVSFMGYVAPVNALDVSNSNTSQAKDSTNPVTSTYSRAIGSVNLNSGALSVTDVNAYSGNNGRAVIEANGQYYMVGNAGNGSGNAAQLTALSNNTGVQSIAVGSSGDTTAVGLAQGTNPSTTGYQVGFSMAQINPLTGKAYGAADKTGKDDNFRGETVSSDGTLYVTKGSGSNGIDTVYQVGATGALANGGHIAANAPITVVAGFNVAPEKTVEATAATVVAANAAVTAFNTANAAGIANGTVIAETYQTVAASEHPFGIWVANSTTMFVADEGDGVRTDAVDSLNKNTTNAGLQEWSLIGGTWKLDQIFQLGLVGTHDTAAEALLGWSVQEDGLRNISGKTNADGSFTIYGTTSTVSNETTHDLGADPNRTVSIDVFASSTAANTAFNVLSTADVGSRFGGVALAPSVAAVPVPAAAWLFGTGLLGLRGSARKRARS
jgi:hypothetical protein